MQRFIVFVLLIFLLSGCSVVRKKAIITQLSDDVYKDHLVNGREINLTEYNFNIKKAAIEINTDEEKQKIIANLKYRKPGNYLLSVRNKTGIEAARIFINEDTILINDRINRKLFYGSTGFLKEKYGLTINAIPILLGDYIFEPRNDAGTDKCINGKLSFTELLDEKNIYGEIDCSNRKIISTFLYSGSGKEQIIIKYSNFSREKGITFPRNINLKDSTGNLSLSIEISEVELGVNDNINFIPGSGYERILLR
jgi:outer membrane biogenesis lipoprotein LolB